MAKVRQTGQLESVYLPRPVQASKLPEKRALALTRNLQSLLAPQPRECHTYRVFRPTGSRFSPQMDQNASRTTTRTFHQKQALFTALKPVNPNTAINQKRDEYISSEKKKTLRLSNLATRIYPALVVAHRRVDRATMAPLTTPAWPWTGQAQHVACVGKCQLYLLRRRRVLRRNIICHLCPGDQ
ncbi:hypothetical protein KL918_005195 [Ogataea parapolymorpha]|nr:hypothetical protein KL918_005195 [Ogataea parapolymorpha]KAG7873378.1 hypothetical protein KL916_002327 [Ogataea parapolymorpha]